MKNFIKNKTAASLLSAVYLFVAFVVFGCNTKDDVTSVFDSKNIGNRPTPHIDSFEAVNGEYAKLAGVGVIRIHGQNFSEVKEENLVQFNDKKGTVLSATSTALEVQVPYLASDTITVQISVQKALQYSNKITMSLQDPCVLLMSDKFQNARSLAVDASNNVYACIADDKGVNKGIVKYDPTTKKYVTFAGTSVSIKTWSAMKFSADGSLYVVGPERRIAVVSPTGGAVSSFVTFATSEGVTMLNDFDFDSQKNIWTGGVVTTSKIYSASPAKVVTAFPFTGEVHAIRVFNNYLYIAVNRNNVEQIVKMKINSNTSLGSEEKVFEVGDKAPADTKISSFTFASDGYMYVGLTQAPGILVVSPNGLSYENYYPSVLQPSSIYGKYSGFAWDSNTFLYAIQDKQAKDKDASGNDITITISQLVKINTLKMSAPYYGKN
ncbi:MAG: IPT/TIG domain-containing protein [Bacteroidota bacterium]|nr:IPT/TIG domain-containing protein [Bacteroidota bacterium]MDP4197487.1 IPT/TIG domain-containing protein [Bacteroidota bacterium]